MARGKSTDSIPSSTTNSAQVSPRKKPITLPAIAPITPAKPPPPPGLSVVTSTPTPASASAPAPAPAVSPAQGPTAITVETPDELVDEPQSSESEAGPSTSSPTPQTPTRSDHPPPPLTDEPIFIHSPYEEPRLYPFPLSDPEFEFHLGLDALELLRDDGSRAYQPSPFNKTLVGLAQMGILAPELPDLLNYQHRESFSGSFQPFDALDEDGSNEAGPSSGVLRTPAKKPSAAIQEEEDWEIEGPRTISRFDFARPSSRSTSGRGQSPFALTRNTRDERAAQMSQQQQHAQHQTPGHGQGQGQSGLENALAAGFGGFGGLGGSSAQGLLSGYGASNEWGNGGHGNAGHESPFGARETGRYKRDREEYDQGEFDLCGQFLWTTRANVQECTFSNNSKTCNPRVSFHPTHLPIPTLMNSTLPLIHPLLPHLASSTPNTHLTLHQSTTRGTSITSDHRVPRHCRRVSRPRIRCRRSADDQGSAGFEGEGRIITHIARLVA